MYFPDFADRTVQGIHAGTGVPFKSVDKNFTSNPMKWTNQLVGEYKPNWRDLARVDLDASTQMTASVSSVEAKRMTMEYTTRNRTGVPGNFTTHRYEGYPVYAIPSIDSGVSETLSAARNLALRRFLDHVNEARTSLEGGELLGEFKETVQAITNPLGALRKFTVRHVINAKKRLRRIQNSHGGRSRGRRGSARNSTPHSVAFSKAMADTYLEFVFGWIPLANDVKSAVVGLLDRYNQPDRKIVKGKAKKIYNASDALDILYTADGLQLRRGHQTSSLIDYRFRGCVRTGAVNGVRSVPATLGLLPERFIPTVWELIPYSFVLDYFINVGDIINSYAFHRSNVIWGTRVIRTTTTREYTAPYLVNDPGVPANYLNTIREVIRQGCIGGDAVTYKRAIERLPLYQDTLMPDFSIHLPVKRKPWINLAAVLTQKFCSLYG
jgi:hypothetical protein